MKRAFLLGIGILLGGAMMACGDDSETATGAGTSAGGGGSSTTGTGGTASTASNGTGGDTTVGSGGAGTGGDPATGSGGTGGAGTGGATGTGGAPTCAPLGDACTTCSYNSCQTDYCTCFGDPDCVSLYTCVATSCAASDLQCLADCAQMGTNYNGASELAVLSNCAAAGCATDCPQVQPLDPCSLCFFESCPDTMNTCVADQACVDMVLCAQAGGDLFTCYMDNPNSEGFSLYGCYNSYCSSACQ